MVAWWYILVAAIGGIVAGWFFSTMGTRMRTLGGATAETPASTATPSA